MRRAARIRKGMHSPYIFADMPQDIAIPLSGDERKFLTEYIADLDVVAAVRRAGVYKGRSPNENTWNHCGNKILERHHVRVALHWLQSYRARHSEINAEKVLTRLWSIATADASELSAVRVFSCRNCYGDDFLYQWVNEIEFSWAKRANEMVTDDGGYGYDPERRPNKACPHCKGLGEINVFLADTRDYSPDARLLYAGAKHTKYGVEVKTHDQMRAMEMVAKILGLYSDTDPTDNQIRVIVTGGLPD